MQKDIRKKLDQYHMLSKGDRILIGLSGGADSVCLAQILYELKEEFELELAAVCCHHGLRGEEADRDVLFAEAFCRERNITFYKEYENVNRRAENCRISVEEAGREFRHETFQHIMKEHGYHKLAIAHNADDRAETMLFHLTRGTGLAGLCTMEPVREYGEGCHLIRPLLWTGKARIENWLREKNISWRVDGSNEEDIYTRNRIRHNVLPNLKQINDRAAEHMGETAEQLGEIYSYLKEEEARIFHQVVEKRQDGLLIHVPQLKEKHPYMKKAILYRCLCEMEEGRKDITSGHVKILLGLLEGDTGREASFMKGIRGRREYDTLLLYKEKEFVGRNQDRENILNHMDISMEKYPNRGEEISKNKYTKHFDCDKILNGLCLRFWQEGDYLYLREDGGKKKLSRYFIDHKIPSEERGRIPLLADGSHILWIVGHRISAYYKVTEKTRTILEVSIKNGDEEAGLEC